MKKTVFTVILTLLILAAFTACGNGDGNSSPADTEASPGQSATSVPSAKPSEDPAAEPSPDMSYAFELEDTEGNVHKLSDYKGTPVYLEIWGSWCGVCVSSLPEMDEFAGEEHEFAVLSVVTPGVAGEMNKEDFIEWYGEQGRENLVVLIDEKAQIVGDFGVSAYPSQIMFDAEGNAVTGFAGLHPKETIIDIMGQIADGTYNG